MVGFMPILIRFLNKDVRDSYPSPWVLVSMVIATLIGLVMYWYTAKAFAPRFEILEGQGSDYFTYLVVGELVLALPLALLLTGVQEFRMYYLSGTLEPIMAAKTSLSRTLCISSLSSAIMSLLPSILTVILALLVFRLDINLTATPLAVLMQIAAAPLFLALGIFAAALFIFFGRGAGFLGSISAMLSVLAGVYFPSSVFPDVVHNFVSNFSPYNILLAESRLLFVRGYSPETITAILTLLIPGLILLPCSYFVLRLSVDEFRRRGVSIFYFG